jgi:hypothetical protein
MFNLNFGQAGTTSQSKNIGQGIEKRRERQQNKARKGEKAEFTRKSIASRPRIFSP